MGSALVPLQEALPAPPAAPPPRRRRLLRLALLAVALGAGGGGFWTWRRLQQARALPPGIAAANGRIEAEPVDVATKFAGRLEAVLVDEGAMVRAGQVLARMDTRELDAALRQAEAQQRGAQRTLEARQAAVVQQRSQLTLAQSELERARTLVQSGAGTRQALDQRQAARDTAVAALNVATAQVAEAEQAEQAAAQAAERIRTQIADSTLVAPIDGRVQYRLAHTGEVLAAGGRVLTLLDITYVYMTVYLPTEQAGRLPLGTEARIILDALPDYVIPATVTFVSPQAQFTPKQVETRSERDRLMFRVKLRIDAELLRQHAEQVRTGLPGMGYVRLGPEIAWPAWLQAGPRTGQGPSR
ncbi:HlyD family efflux transporter periplasmic adaptor subunit [Roseicella aquatilis]|uniref:HlyD family efflux transporter periplasmic adaptor subunit n=2 Tax=Roseicella aquatilis TaxID=2527868 RepID=A0A4R4DTQ5_9PROT|nr:HlyD family efflux transporter periplasmic adaptor subunit [Roseicella aquatilis]